MTTTEQGELLKHVLAARDSAHPGIPDEFLSTVLNAIEDAGSDADAAMRAIEAAADRALADGADIDAGTAPQTDNAAEGAG
jgi:hypothetical protein